MTIIAEQCGKAGGRIKPRPTEPINRAVTAHQGGRLAIADHSVIFDWLAHVSRVGSGVNLEPPAGLATVWSAAVPRPKRVGRALGLVIARLWPP